jgi:hypothetical protein
MLLAVDSGVVSGNNTLADVLFLVACIVFFIVAFVRLFAEAPRDLFGGLVAVGLGLVALALFLL